MEEKKQGEKREGHSQQHCTILLSALICEKGNWNSNLKPRCKGFESNNATVNYQVMYMVHHDMLAKGKYFQCKYYSFLCYITWSFFEKT